MYNIFDDRNKIAQMIAAHASRIKDAVAEDVDYALADKVVRLIDEQVGDIYLITKR